MGALKNLIEQAENSSAPSRRQAHESRSSTAEIAPTGNEFEPTAETISNTISLPAGSPPDIFVEPDRLAPPFAEPDIQPAHPEPAPAALPESELAILLQSYPSPEPEPVTVAPQVTPEITPEAASAEAAVEPPPSNDGAAGVPGPADRRAQILELADQGVEISEIARQLDTSRAEVELIVSFRRPR